MSKVLNFNTVTKRYLPVMLADEKQTTLFVGTPTKAIFDELTSLKSSLETLSEDESDRDASDSLYEACAKVMSRNKGGVKITKAQLEKLFDFEDVMIFFNAYMEFLGEVSNSKN